MFHPTFAAPKKKERYANDLSPRRLDGRTRAPFRGHTRARAGAFGCACASRAREHQRGGQCKRQFKRDQGEPI